MATVSASWPNRDDYFTRDFSRNIGAEIMGRNKCGPQRGPWRDHEWQGWWGEEPPFHFLDATPQEAFEQARRVKSLEVV